MQVQAQDDHLCVAQVTGVGAAHAQSQHGTPDIALDAQFPAAVLSRPMKCDARHTHATV